MLFSRLVVHNFRSIGPEGVEISFSKELNLAAIVGANGTGKSNIMTALGVVLGMYPFNRFSPSPTDFNRMDTDAEILIELHLDPHIIDYDIYRREFEIAGFRYRAYRRSRGEDKGALNTEHYCFSSDGL